MRLREAMIVATVTLIIGSSMALGINQRNVRAAQPATVEHIGITPANSQIYKLKDGLYQCIIIENKWWGTHSVSCR